MGSPQLGEHGGPPSSNQGAQRQQQQHQGWTVSGSAGNVGEWQRACAGGLPLPPPPQISARYTHYAATALFFFFGLKSLYDWAQGKQEVRAVLSCPRGTCRALAGERPTVLTPYDCRNAIISQENELAEVEQELAAADKKDASKKGAAGKRAGSALATVFLKAFTLTFVAEWGDRSQIATIGCVSHFTVGCCAQCDDRDSRGRAQAAAAAHVTAPAVLRTSEAQRGPRQEGELERWAVVGRVLSALSWRATQVGGE